jgi:hypothetical protein
VIARQPTVSDALGLFKLELRTISGAMLHGVPRVLDGSISRAYGSGRLTDDIDRGVSNNMEKYDPMLDVDSEQWEALDTDERINFVWEPRSSRCDSCNRECSGESYV